MTYEEEEEDYYSDIKIKEDDGEDYSIFCTECGDKGYPSYEGDNRPFVCSKCIKFWQ